ncbi:MAG: VWA domain-containing protein [Planctomycetia bacterium]|nr:VWA domain-containing protein [Planctomycetia bacterium]
MPFGMNLWMLLGLGAVVLPPLIHLLNRRRYDVVDWGAMRFLRVGETTRRRLQLEQLLLMLLRMLLIAVLVLGLAAPFVEGEFVGPLAARLGERPNRDLAIVIDGSASMACRQGEGTAQQAAQRLALALLDELQSGDGVTLWLARQQPQPLLGEVTQDVSRARQALQHLPPPAGTADMPAAVQAALTALARGQRAERRVVILTDGQRFGWSDEQTLLRWRLLAARWREQRGQLPELRIVNVSPQRPEQPPNWSVTPLRAGRAVAARGQSVQFRAGLQVTGQTEFAPPFRLRIEIDGQPAEDLKLPAAALDKDGRIALDFRQRFSELGSHLVSLIVEPDPPPEQRPAGYVVKDWLPADNRADFALEVVPALPVLLVDGDEANPPRADGQRGSDFLRDALAPARDPQPAAVVRSVGIRDFTPELLTQSLSKDERGSPRVVVLCNVARLTPAQQEALTAFLARGGGLLITLGERADRTHYNSVLHAGGRGWLPATLDRVSGAELEPKDAVRPRPESFFHPALELFREGTVGGLSEARFRRWWKVQGGQSAGLLGNGDPLFVEKPLRGGRVLLSVVPLDNSWRSNLPDLPAFAPLIHELVYYLAGTRAGSFNLQPGEPLLPPTNESAGERVLLAPDGSSRRLPAGTSPLVEAGRSEPGVYRLAAGGQTTYYVVQTDPREAVLTAATAEDREAVRQLLPLTYADDPHKLSWQDGGGKLDLWPAVLLGVVLLLCAELWLTRRIARHRS